MIAVFWTMNFVSKEKLLFIFQTIPHKKDWLRSRDESAVHKRSGPTFCCSLLEENWRILLSLFMWHFVILEHAIFVSYRSFHPHFPWQLLCAFNGFGFTAQCEPRQWLFYADGHRGLPYWLQHCLLPVGLVIHQLQRWALLTRVCVSNPCTK